MPVRRLAVQTLREMQIVSVRRFAVRGTQMC